MITLLSHQSIAKFPTEAAAQAVADQCTDQDPDWTYVVTPIESGQFIVVILDEGGHPIGPLG